MLIINKFAAFKIIVTKDKFVNIGGLAQLARALAWHARGHRFDSDILHGYRFNALRLTIMHLDE